jgi:hypothetical protein
MRGSRFVLSREPLHRFTEKMEANIMNSHDLITAATNNSKKLPMADANNYIK